MYCCWLSCLNAGETKEPAQKVAAYHITVDKVLSYKDIPEGKTEVQTARDMKPATRDGGSVLTVNKRQV